MNKSEVLNGFDPVMERDHIIAWLRDWFDAQDPSGTKHAVIGISGGKDSTIAAALLARAIGPDRVLGVLLPNGHQSDLDDVKAVIDALAIPSVMINIGPIVAHIYASVIRAVIPKDADFQMSSDSMINTPPRVRMTVLRNLAQSSYGNGFVINTCNRSETYIGYSTKDGDGTGDVSPLGAYLVSEIVAIGRTIPEIPEYLVVKAPADGLCGHTDEDRFGFTYAELDQYLCYMDQISRYVGNQECVDRKMRLSSPFPHRTQIFSMHKASEHKRNPMPVCPKRCDHVL